MTGRLRTFLPSGVRPPCSGETSLRSCPGRIVLTASGAALVRRLVQPPVPVTTAPRDPCPGSRETWTDLSGCGRSHPAPRGPAAGRSLLLVAGGVTVGSLCSWRQGRRRGRRGCSGPLSGQVGEPGPGGPAWREPGPGAEGPAAGKDGSTTSARRTGRRSGCAGARPGLFCSRPLCKYT